MWKEYYPVSRNFKELVGLIKDYLGADYDFSAAVDGEKGNGKSTLTLQFGRGLHGGRFDGLMEKCLCFGQDEVLKKMFEVKDGILINDEAITTSYSQEFMRRESVLLKKVFAQIRTRHLAYFMNIPSFWDLDRYYRNRVTLWIHVIARGTALVFAKDKDPSLHDPWHQRDMSKLLFGVRDVMCKPMLTPEDVDKIKSRLQRIPTYQMSFEFPTVDPETYKTYIEIRNRRVKEESVRTFADMHKWERQAKTMLYNAYKTVDMTQEEIRDKLLIDPITQEHVLTQGGISIQLKSIERQLYRIRAAQS